MLAEYAANGSVANPQKEYGYRNGQLLVTLDAPAGPPNGYAFRRTITIDHTKVPNTDQSNFPVLISGTYTELATTANGGNVQNANGYDVIFTSDSGCATKLNHEVETYTAATGAVNYWVKVPVLSHTTDTTLYLCYGNASVSTDQSNKTAVWDTNYKGVWHLPNGTTLNSSDSSLNGNSGTITGAVATAGKTDGGASLNGTSDHIQVKAGKVDTSATTGTVSAWVKVSALDKNGVVLGYGGGDAALWGVYIREVSGSYYFATASRKTNAGVYNTVRGNTALTSGTWYYVTYSTNGSAWKIRVNGSTAQTLTAVLGTNTGDWIGDITTSTPDKSDIGGIYAGGAYSTVNYWNGTLDEVRLSNVERSDDWVTAEYNNQSSPSTFYTLSRVTSLTPPSQVQWLVADQLGTPRMIVDETGALANMKRHDYLPFGEELIPPTGGRTAAMGYTSDGIRQQFTLKERDVETGLDYSIARYYSYTQGRFTGADPYLIIFEMKRGRDAEEQQEMLLEYLMQPQNWAKYNYALNNPLKHTDPTGMRPPSKYEKQALGRLDELANQADAAGDTDLANGLREARTQIANTIDGLRTGQQNVGINVAVNAILNVGNSDYSNSATVAIRTSSGTITIGGPSNKCNCLVASAFARGAGLGFIRNGQHGRGFPLIGGLPPVANWLGDARDRKHLSNLGIVTDGSLKPGDIVAWRTTGGVGQGHSSIHIGGNLLVYAGGPPDGTPQARTLNYVNSRLTGPFGGHEPYVVRRYNGKP